MDDEDEAAEAADEAAEETAREQRGQVRGRPFTPGNPWRFAPGQSGNPNGRPRGISDLIDRVIEEEIDTQGELGKRGALELMVRAMVRTALKGGTAGTSAFRELMDRRYGRVPLSVRLGPEDDAEGPAVFRIRVVSREDVETEAERVPAKALLTDGKNGDGNNGGS